MIIGYARVSTEDQNLELQIEAIEKYAADQGEEFEIYFEKQSGGKADREELKKALKALRKGDTLVIYKLDHLARSTKQLYTIHENLEQKGVNFVSLSDSIDTTTAAGRAMFGMIAVFAEFERNLIRERTRAGLESAKKQGRTGGRPPLTEKQKQQIVTLFKGGERAVDIAKEYGIGRSTVYKVLNEVEGFEAK
ncbi:resolvase [Bacillus sp. SA1-12]|uniref:recombinase family protein n=1 Tax=Bacillus sp. SA1-12 TaxID=1455638 RepID=UPI0006273C99|nr:recombinase family protein [Bacillus sp. SA1-12]KKI88452.1 resolvase [Bacillus sp. SA1-12]